MPWSPYATVDLPPHVLDHDSLVSAADAWIADVMQRSEPSTVLKLRFIRDEIQRCREALEDIVASKKSNWCARRAQKALEGRD